MFSAWNVFRRYLFAFTSARRVQSYQLIKAPSPDSATYFLISTNCKQAPGFQLCIRCCMRICTLYMVRTGYLTKSGYWIRCSIGYRISRQSQDRSHWGKDYTRPWHIQFICVKKKIVSLFVFHSYKNKIGKIATKYYNMLIFYCIILKSTQIFFRGEPHSLIKVIKSKKNLPKN